MKDLTKFINEANREVVDYIYMLGDSDNFMLLAMRDFEASLWEKGEKLFCFGDAGELAELRGFLISSQDFGFIEKEKLAGQKKIKGYNLAQMQKLYRDFYDLNCKRDGIVVYLFMNKK